MYTPVCVFMHIYTYVFMYMMYANLEKKCVYIHAAYVFMCAVCAYMRVLHLHTSPPPYLVMRHDLDVT